MFLFHGDAVRCERTTLTSALLTPDMAKDAENIMNRSINIIRLIKLLKK